MKTKMVDMYREVLRELHVRRHSTAFDWGVVTIFSAPFLSRPHPGDDDDQKNQKNKNQKNQKKKNQKKRY